MLAGPPPTSFNTSPTLPTVQPKSQFNSSMLKTEYGSSILPPNFNPAPSARAPMFPPVHAQPPVLPPNYPAQLGRPPMMPTAVRSGNPETMTVPNGMITNGIGLFQRVQLFD